MYIPIGWSSANRALANFYDTLTDAQRHHLAGALGADLLIGGKAQGAGGDAATFCERQAAESRLRAMLEASNAVRPALNDFYASLEDEQKLRFNILGQPRGRSVAR